MHDTAMGLSLHTCQKNIEKNLRVICTTHTAMIGGWKQPGTLRGAAKPQPSLCQLLAELNSGLFSGFMHSKL